MKKLLYDLLVKKIVWIWTIDRTKFIAVAILLFAGGLLANAEVMRNQQSEKKLTITGTVRETSGETLTGVSVSIKGTTVGTITDMNGKYSIDVGSPNAILDFSYIGEKSKEVSVDGKTVINVVLDAAVTSLQEVVVSTGYMTQKKADLTGALTMASASDIAKNPSANAIKSLQGQLPGVYITGDGNPAADVDIQIRGLSSLTAQAPPLIVVDGQPVNINLRDINGMDIESIQVLKDAASASIYGSRAASGVILIQTKKGKKGTVVNYDASVGLSKLINAPNMLNTDEYGRAIWQATVNDGDDPSSIQIYNYTWHRDANHIPILDAVSPVQWLNPEHTMPSANTNWFDALTKVGFQTNQQVTVSNGNDHSKSLFSLNYYDNNGTELYSYFKRYSMRLNTEYNLLNNSIQVGENFSLAYISLNSGSDVYDATIMPSIIPVHTTDGGWGGTAMKLGMDDYWNPVRDRTVNSDNNDNFVKALGSAYINIKILKNLQYKSQFGVNYTENYHRYTDHTWTEGGGKSDNINGVDNKQNHDIDYTWTNTLNYKITATRFNLDLLAGTEYYHYYNDGFRAYRKNILFEDKDYAILNAATGNKTTEGWADESVLLSYFGKANFSFDSKYLLSTTLRYDGSSKFGVNNRYGFFPAVSGGWRMSSENFMKNITFLSNLKIRGSWGKNGNSNIQTNSLTTNYIADYNSTSYAINGNESGDLYSGYHRINIGNSNLKWETTTQTNIGFDYGVFDQRITGTLDYFYKKTTDMLFTPAYIGALGEEAFQVVNAGAMSNSGIEIALNYSNSPTAKFKYTIGGNISTYRNKIISLPDAVLYDFGGNGLGDNILGRPKNSFYGLVADGIFKTQEEVDNSPEQPGKGVGRIRYKDLNGDGRIDETNDRTWIGIKDPDFMYGINFSASFKGFDYSMFLQGIVGSQVYDDWKVYADFWNITVQNDKNHLKDVLNAWSLSNPNSNIPALSRRDENGEGRMSTYFIENGSYLKLRTMEFGYTFPAKIVQRLKLQRLRTYISVQNLLTIKKWWGSDQFTGPDPENPNFAYRIPLTLNYGVNVTF